MRWIGEMRRTRRLGLGLLSAGLAAIALGPAGPARAVPQVMSQASSDAQIVVTAGNLQQASQQISSLLQTTKLPAPRQSRNLAGTMQNMIGARQGFNADGGMVISVSGLKKAIQNPMQNEPTAVFVLPVSDYAAFAGNYNAEANGVSQIRMPIGQQAYIRKLGEGHAILSKKQAAVKNYKPGEGAQRFTQATGGLGGQYLNNAAVSVWVDMQALGPAVTSKLRQAFDQQRDELQRNIDQGQTNEAAMAVFEKVSQSLVNATENAQAVVLAFEVNKQGVGLSLAAQQGEDSQLSQHLKTSQSGVSDIIGQLPAQDYLFALGLDTQALGFGELADQAKTMIRNAMPPGANGAAHQPVLDLVEQWGSLAGQTQSTASAWYVPGQQAMMSGGALQQVTISQVSDPEQYLKGSKQLMQQIEPASKVSGQAGQGEGPPGQQRGATVTYNDEAVQVEVDGQTIAADQYQIQANIPQQAMQQMGPAAMLLGGGNKQGYIAARENYVVSTLSQDQALLKSGLQAAVQGQGLAQSPAFKKIADRALPPNPFFAGYLSFGGVAQMANHMAPMLGAQPQGQGPWIQVPQDLAPLAIGAGAKNNGIALRLYLPGETIGFVGQTVQTKIMPMIKRMNRGQPGGQGPQPRRRPGGPQRGPAGRDNQPGGPGNPPAQPAQPAGPDDNNGDNSDPAAPQAP